MFANKTVNILRRAETVSSSGASVEAPSEHLADGVRCSIQAHVLNTLPPPGQMHNVSGINYIEEYRCWIATSLIPGITIRAGDYIENVTDSKLLRITAAIDDAGVKHHWLLRLVEYD